jgi:hypothetical protein
MRLLMRVSLVLRVNSEDSANSCLHAHTLSTQVSASRLSSQSCIGANYDVGSKYFYFFYYSAIGDWGIGIFVVVVGDSAKLLSPPRTKKKKKIFFFASLFFFFTSWRGDVKSRFFYSTHAFIAIANILYFSCIVFFLSRSIFFFFFLIDFFFFFFFVFLTFVAFCFAMHSFFSNGCC